MHNAKRVFHRAEVHPFGDDQINVELFIVVVDDQILKQSGRGMPSIDNLGCHMRQPYFLLEGSLFLASSLTSGNNN